MPGCECRSDALGTMIAKAAVNLEALNELGVHVETDGPVLWVSDDFKGVNEAAVERVALVDEGGTLCVLVRVEDDGEHLVEVLQKEYDKVVQQQYGRTSRRTNASSTKYEIRVHMATAINTNDCPGMSNSASVTEEYISPVSRTKEATRPTKELSN